MNSIIIRQLKPQILHRVQIDRRCDSPKSTFMNSTIIHVEFSMFQPGFPCSRASFKNRFFYQYKPIDIPALGCTRRRHTIEYLSCYYFTPAKHRFKFFGRNQDTNVTHKMISAGPSKPVTSPPILKSF